MARDSRVTGQEAGSGGDIRVGPLLAVFFCCAFMASFNENIVNVALVDIQGEFGIGEALSQWLVTGYMIVTTIVVTVVAFLQKRFTLRAIFYGGATILLVGSRWRRPRRPPSPCSSWRACSSRWGRASSSRR